MSSPDQRGDRPHSDELPNPTIETVARDDLITEWIGWSLIQSAPADWQRIDLMATMTVEVVDIKFTVIMEDGSTPDVELPEGVHQALADLRQEMYQKDRGTWFSARITIDPPGEHKANFNFDLEPVCTPPIPDKALIRDLDTFPRDREFIPPWLQAKIDDYHKSLYEQYTKTAREKHGH